PAAGELRERTVLRLLVEAQAAQDAGGSGRRRMGVDVDEAGLDVRNALGVACALGLGDQRRPLGVGREHEVDQRLRAARRLLLDAAEPGVLGRGDRAALGGEIAADQAEKGGLARAVAPDEADPRPARKCSGRAVDQQPLPEAVGQPVDMKHRGLLARNASGCKDWHSDIASSRPPEKARDPADRRRDDRDDEEPEPVHIPPSRARPVITTPARRVQTFASSFPGRGVAFTRSAAIYATLYMPRFPYDP